MVALLTVRLGNTVVDQCNATCYEATGRACRCICEGRNHGVGLDRAIVNTRRLHTDWVRRAKNAGLVDSHELGADVEQLPLFPL